MEPTAVKAIAAMERKGFIRRRRNRDDARKINLTLTPRGRALKKTLLPFAFEVIQEATGGFSPREAQQLLRLLHRIQRNLEPVGEGAGNGMPGVDQRTRPGRSSRPAPRQARPESVT
jgi:hypothetical protein